jgi:beta-galactosidase
MATLCLMPIIRLILKLTATAFIASVDNGDPVSHDPFKASYRKAFHGLALAILQSNEKAGVITFTATADGLAPGNHDAGG